MKLSKNKIAKSLLISTLIGSLILSACSALPSIIPSTATPTATATATAVPLKTLVVCLGDEPKSLYMYGDSSQSMWSVLESIYDGPFDTINYEPQAVIVKEVPTQDNGGVEVKSAAVSEGDLVANTEGDVVALEKGVTVFPAGCTTSGCAVAWDGSSPLSLSQMSVTFKLLDGIKWSDGQALTAADSVFSYTVAADPTTTSSKLLVKKTASYTAVDDSTVNWVGVPGYLTQNPSAFFWTPLPQHSLKDIKVADLASNDAAAKAPLGWGAYKIDEWKPGDHIRLVKNTNYFRASEGLPYFDVVDYRFLGNLPQTDLSPILTGECDIIDSSVDMVDQIQTVRSMELDKKLKGYYGEGPEWEGINFGIQNSAYDDSLNPWTDRVDFFGDARTRQAVADCVDRDSIIKDFLFSQSEIPSTYLTSSHPYFVKDLPAYSYNPDAGKALLDQVGWMDTDNDPSTPRVSQNVANVLNSKPFEVNYLVADSGMDVQIANAVAANLQTCGIKANVQAVSAADLYASGPTGAVFGRNFDLVQMGWTSGRQNPCFLFATSEVPSAANDWMGTKFGGVNLTGYSNSTYDQACQTYLTAGLDAGAASTANQTALTQLATDVPMVPLYFKTHMMISRPDLCGLNFDVTARSGLKDIESLSLGTCSN
jgi:peptide/nickel transport system substrate-binding protein